MAYAEVSVVTNTIVCGSNGVNRGAIASISFSVSEDFNALELHSKEAFLVSSIKSFAISEQLQVNLL